MRRVIKCAEFDDVDGRSGGPMHGGEEKCQRRTARSGPESNRMVHLAKRSTGATFCSPLFRRSFRQRCTTMWQLHTVLVLGYGTGGTGHFRRGRCLGSHRRSRPKMGAIDAPTYCAEAPIAPGPTTRSLRFIGGPEGSPPAAAYLDRQPGISGRIGEADSAQPTRNGPCHTRLGFGP